MERGRKGGQKYDRKVYRSLVLITQMGINMLVPIGLMSAAGVWLDRRSGTGFWTILLFFAGAVAGGQNVYRMSKQIYDTDGKKEPDRVHEEDRDVEKQE